MYSKFCCANLAHSLVSFAIWTQELWIPQTSSRINIRHTVSCKFKRHSFGAFEWIPFYYLCLMFRSPASSGPLRTFTTTVVLKIRRIFIESGRCLEWQGVKIWDRRFDKWEFRDSPQHIPFEAEIIPSAPPALSPEWWTASRLSWEWQIAAPALSPEWWMALAREWWREW